MPKLPFINASWMFFDYGLVTFANLLVSVFLAKYLGVEQYGVFISCFAFVTLFTPLFQVGMNGLLSKEVLSHSDERFVVISALILRLASTVVFGTILLVIAYSIPSFSPFIHLIAILTLGHIGLSFVICESWFQAKKVVKGFSLTRTIVVIMFAVMKCILVLRSDNLSLIAGIYCIEFWVIGTFTWRLFLAKTKIKDSALSSKYFKHLIAKGSLLIFSGMASIVNLKIDQVMILSMLSKQQSGIYGIASKISEVVFIIPNIVVAALFPYLLGVYAKSRLSYRQHSAVYFSILFYLAVVLSSVCVLLSSIVIPSVFGNNFSHSAVILNVYIWSSIFVFARALINKLLVIEDLLVFSLLSQLVGAVVNILLNLLMIPYFGILGSAYATLFSYFFSSLFVFIFFKRTRWFVKSIISAPVTPFVFLFKRSMN